MACRNLRGWQKKDDVYSRFIRPMTEFNGLINTDFAIYIQIPKTHGNMHVGTCSPKYLTSSWLLKKMILLFNMPEKRHLKIVKKPGKRQIFRTNMEGINLKKKCLLSPNFLWSFDAFILEIINLKNSWKDAMGRDRLHN